MTDKEKFRKEVEKLKSNLIYGACSSQIAMETMCKEEAYNEVLALLDTMQEEPVSDDLEEAANNALSNVLNAHEIVNVRSCLEMFKSGANWQKKRDYIPLSDDINEVAEQICNKVLNCEIDYKEDDVVLSDEEECVKAGIRWQMQKESIPSKDLEELINSLSKQFPEVSFAKLSRIAVRVAKWQKEKMMAKAIDGVIAIDYYGDDDKTYGCIAHDSFCLEDFGLKDMDKVKMILIKED